MAAVESGGFDLWAPGLDGSSPQTFESHLDQDGEPQELVNIGGASDDDVSLAEAMSAKLDTPMYALTEQIGGNAIADSAARLGIDRMWDPHDLDEDGIAAEIATTEANAEFRADIGIGAYPITVLDAASMHATLAAGGTSAEPYFVERVHGPEGEILDVRPDTTEGAVDPWLALDLAVPLYENAREAEYGTLAVNASSTWHTGFNSGLALAVWAGDETKEGDGSSHEGTIAEGIWWKLMESLPERYRDGGVAEPVPTDAVGDGGIETEGEVPIDEEQAAKEEAAEEEAAVADETGEDKPQDDGVAPTTEDVTVEPSDAAEDDGGGWFD
jgi:membrane peptidoglycan carboxypeptidase